MSNSFEHVAAKVFADPIRYAWVAATISALLDSWKNNEVPAQDEREWCIAVAMHLVDGLETKEYENHPDYDRLQDIIVQKQKVDLNKLSM